MAKKKTTGVVETGKVIRKTNQLYLSLKNIGTLDENGKSILSVGYKGRMEAPPDRGLLLLVLVMDHLQDFLSYSSVEAAENDLKLLKKHINQIKVTKGNSDA
jgi:hypothetical protein